MPPCGASGIGHWPHGVTEGERALDRIESRDHDLECVKEGSEGARRAARGRWISIARWGEYGEDTGG